METYRPTIGQIYQDFLQFVLKKHGKTRGTARLELEEAVKEYLENHKGEVKRNGRKKAKHSE